MRIESWINLADCVLIVDGQRIPTSRPFPVRRGRCSVGLAHTDADFLADRLGAEGLIQTRDGELLMRLRIERVDLLLNQLEGTALAV